MPQLPTEEYLYYAGIDPGYKGAVAVMNAKGTTAKVFPMPLNDEKEIDLGGLRDIFAHLRRLPRCCVGIEWPTAWPGSFANVTRDAEHFGRQKGLLEAFAFLKGLPYFKLAPPLWKGRLGLDGKAQDGANERGAGLLLAFYPELRALIYGPRGGLLDGRLDSLLICHFLRSSSTTGMKSIADKFGKGSPEAMAFILGGGRRKMKFNPPKNLPEGSL